MGFYNYCYFLIEFKHKGVTVLQDFLDVSISLLNLFFFLLSSYLKDVILLIFLLIVAYYITNFIVPSINKSTLGTGDYPEINPENDWWKDVKDTISENKTTIFVCSVSVGIAIYFYYKYQTTSSDLVEILKQTKELENLVKKETRFTLVGSSINQKESIGFENKTLRALLEEERGLKALIEKQKESIILENERLKALVEKQSLHASKELSSHFRKLYRIGNVITEAEYTDRKGCRDYNLVTIINQIERDFLKAPVTLTQNYNDRRLKILNEFFDIYEIFLNIIDNRNQNRKHALQNVKDFILKNPYVADKSNQEYLSFQENLKLFLFNNNRFYNEQYKSKFLDRFYEVFFTYDASKNSYLTKNSALNQYYYYHPLKLIRKNLILEKKLDFASSFKHFNPTNGDEMKDPNRRCIFRRDFFCFYFFPSVYKDLFISNAYDLTKDQLEQIEHINKLVKQNQIFSDETVFKNSIEYLASLEVPYLDIVRLNKNQLNSFVQSFYEEKS